MVPVKVEPSPISLCSAVGIDESSLIVAQPNRRDAGQDQQRRHCADDENNQVAVEAY